MYRGIRQFPIIPSKISLLFENESRDSKIIAALVRMDVEMLYDDAKPLLYELMSATGARCDELDELATDEAQVVKTINEKYPDDILARAKKILETGDPFNFYMDKWKQFYAITNDDDSVGSMTICVIGSTLISNSKGLHEKVGGPSGYGKSAGIKATFNLFPPDKTLVSSMSPKAAFYADLKQGTVIYCDDIDLTKRDFFTTVKQGTSDYQNDALMNSVNNGANVQYSLAARIGWILSSVDNFSDEQLDSRFGETEVDNSIDQQQAIFEKQAAGEFEKSEAGIPDDDVLVCRCIWEMLESEGLPEMSPNGGLYEIRIPFIKAITWTDIKHPRSFPFFMDMIRCMTLFKIKQREKVGNFYLATIDDYNQAKEIYKKMEHINATKLNTKEISILEYLAKQYRNQDNMVNLKKVSRMDLVEYLGKHHDMKQQNIIDVIHGKKDGDAGLLNKVTGLQAEKMSNNVFGGTNLWWYWYSGNITKDGFADSIMLDEELAKLEVQKWREAIN